MSSAVLPSARTAGWLTVIAVASLLVYGILQGYHRDPELLLTVIVVRLVAGYGMAAAVGALVAIGMLIRRRPDWLAGFVLSTLALGSLTVVGLAIFNLVETL